MATGEVFVQTPAERTEHLNHRINSLGCEIAHLSRQLCRAVERIQVLELKLQEGEEECDAEDSPQYIGDIGHHRAVRRVQPRSDR